MNEVLISEFARGGAAQGSPLRPAVWSELTARLAAMRDLRQSLPGFSRAGEADFSSLAAAGYYSPAAFTNPCAPCGETWHPGPQVNAGVRYINPNALADRKDPVPIHSAEPNCVTPGDRELK